jgi:hypothetical protein
MVVQTKRPALLRTAGARPTVQHKEITMSNTSLQSHNHAVKHGRFVPATPESQAELERQVGRSLYRRGKPLRECVTDDMAAGWIAAERAGADAYYRCMMAEASSQEAM